MMIGILFGAKVTSAYWQKENKLSQYLLSENISLDILDKIPKNDKKYITEITGDQLQLLGKRPDDSTGEGGQVQQEKPQQAAPAEPVNPDQTQTPSTGQTQTPSSGQAQTPSTGQGDPINSGDNGPDDLPF